MSKKVLIVEDQYVEANYLRSLLIKAGYHVCGIARSVSIAREMIADDRPDLVILDIFLSGKLTGIDLAKELKAAYIAFIYLSANSNEDVLATAKVTQPCGFLVKPFREKDLLIALEISAYRHDYGMEAILRKEDLLRQELFSLRTSTLSPDQKLASLVKIIQPFIPFDFITIVKSGVEKIDPGFLRIGVEEYQRIGLDELTIVSKRSQQEILALPSSNVQHTSASLFTEEAFDQLTQHRSMEQLLANTFELQSLLKLPISPLYNEPGFLCLYSKQASIYTPRHLSFYERLQHFFIETFQHILEKKVAVRDVDTLLKSNSHDNIQKPNTVEGFEGIIGKHHLMLNVIDQVIQVAPSDTSVFILGESGTGKEGIANCIHKLSKRRNEPLIKVNCGALPPTLVESELFGHEKGSFTGAVERKIGKFELADKGTIFLDEIGEMPSSLQVKLLRVLQEKEIERIGGRSTIKVDIRIIAATNRNLEKEIAEGRFRLDLYYRLFVFPIELPPLRDRIDDLPALAYHFMHLYNRKTGKKINSFTDKVFKAMMDYEWPGNIRQLEHLVERSVLLTKGTTIDNIALPFKLSTERLGLVTEKNIKTIHENERDYIIDILKKCNGRIWGVGGAAQLLNIPPSTLKSKMIKLGIKKDY